jgi:hypothetical protein
MESRAAVDAKKTARAKPRESVRRLVWFASREAALLLLHMCGHEGVSALLGVLRRLFVVNQVMPENVERLFRRHVEDVGSAVIDDDLEIGLACDRLTLRGWCPVVFLAKTLLSRSSRSPRRAKVSSRSSSTATLRNASTPLLRRSV